MKLLLNIHDFDPACLVGSSKDIAIFSYCNSRNVFEESVNLTDGLLLESVDYFYVTALS